MGSDVLRRVRWGNVVRAAGVVVIVGAVVAWPRMTPPEPAVPAPEARPLEQPRPEAPEPRGLTEAELRGGREALPRGDGRRRREPRARDRRSKGAVRRGDRGDRGRREAGDRGDRRRRDDRGDRERRAPDGSGGGSGGETITRAAPPAAPPPPAPAQAPAPPVGDPAQTEFGIESG